MIRRSLLTLLALVLALVTSVAACGGDDDSADSPPGDDAPADDTSTDDPDAEAETGDGVDEGGEGGEGAAEQGDEGAGGDAGGDGTAEQGDVSTQLGVDRDFTGEGSEGFCAEVVTMRDTGQDAAGVDDAAFADSMMAITPPAEIAAEWTNLFTVQKAIAADPSGGALAAMSQEDLDAWAMDGNVVAADLGDVCGLAGEGG